MTRKTLTPGLGIDITETATRGTVAVDLIAGDNITFVSSSASGSLTISANSGSNNTLDQAYRQGGTSVGRFITADGGPVQIEQPGGDEALAVSGTIILDKFGLGKTRIDGTLEDELLRIEEYPVTATSAHYIFNEADLNVSGAVVRAQLGFSGSLTRLYGGTSYLVAGANITVTSESNGQVTIASTASGGGGADPEASYVVMGLTGSLANERSLAASDGVTLADAGTGSTATLSADGTVARISGSHFTGNITVVGTGSFEAGISGSLTRLVDGTSYLIAGSNITVTSASSGAITIASTATGGGGSTDPSVIHSSQETPAATTIVDAALVADRAYFMPFHLHASETIKRMTIVNGPVPTGTGSVALYNLNGTLIVSASAGLAGASVTQLFEISDASLDPGRYYMAILCDDNSNDVRGWADAASTGIPALAAGIKVETDALSFALTASFTDPGNTDTTFPLITSLLES